MSPKERKKQWQELIKKQPRLTRTNLADEVSRVLVVPRDMAMEVVDAIFDSMIEELNKGKDRKVMIYGFGKWWWRPHRVNQGNSKIEKLRKSPLNNKTIYMCRFRMSPVLIREVDNPKRVRVFTYDLQRKWTARWRKKYGRKYMREYMRKYYKKLKAQKNAVKKFDKDDPMRKRWE